MIKQFRSESYNYNFDMDTGVFARWGKKWIDDPQFSPFGPEIFDIELSSICHRSCSWCYKSNTSTGKNMSLETFKILFSKLPRALVQIAFGLGSLTHNGELVNPDLWKIMEYCRRHEVIPNITINGDNMTPEIAHKLVSLCGAVAVSLYDYNQCCDTVKMLTDLGLTQCNIHVLLCQENYDKCIDIMKAQEHDPRLSKMGAIVFLMLKQKGRGINSIPIGDWNYQQIINYAMDNNIRVGFDSCGANKFLEAIKDRPDYEQMKILVEPCESTCFSYYIDVNGIGHPCSFAEGCCDYKGINVLEAKDFIKDVWNHEETLRFRKKCLENCRKCILYDLGEHQHG